MLVARTAPADPGAARPERHRRSPGAQGRRSGVPYRPGVVQKQAFQSRADPGVAEKLEHLDRRQSPEEGQLAHALYQQRDDLGAALDELVPGVLHLVRRAAVEQVDHRVQGHGHGHGHGSSLDHPANQLNVRWGHSLNGRMRILGAP